MDLAQLIMMEGPNIGTTYTLEKKNIIGSSERCNIHLDSEKGKKELFALEQRDNIYYLIPLGEPVQVNGQVIHAPRQLLHGDSIKIANMTLLYGEGSENVVNVQEDVPNISSRQKYFKDPEAALKNIGQTKHGMQNMGFLVKVSHAITSKMEIKDLLPLLLDIIFDYLPADRGTILLKDPISKKMWPMATKKLKDIEQTEKLMVSRTIIKEVLDTKEGILTQDAMEDGRFSQGLSVASQKIHAAICVPLIGKEEEILGVIHIDTVRSDRYFTEEHLSLVNAIALQASAVIENAILIQQLGEKHRIEQEMATAHHIQQELLPKKNPNFPGLDVYGFMKPAKEIGGDYFDFIVSEDQKKLTVCIGDVSGKGVPAGLVMVMARCFVHPLILSGASTRDILSQVNNFLVEDTRKDMFMSFLMMQWDIATKKFRWTGAGHEHILIYRNKTKKCETIRTGGLVLGMLKNANRLFKEQELVLELGDTILLYTDGVTECIMEPPNKMLELEGLVALVEQYGHLPSKDLCVAILEELKKGMLKVPQFDDITLVGIKYVGE
jgi:serine phosphatase RsbU (regulator of sigma subunit)